MEEELEGRVLGDADACSSQGGSGGGSRSCDADTVPAVGGEREVNVVEEGDDDDDKDGIDRGGNGGGGGGNTGWGAWWWGGGESSR